ncbi:NAD(P)H-binding protein [Natrialbaceae archaeon A-gly3]
MHTLVTGATGFVGSRLVPALCEAGHDVSVLVRDATSYDAPEEVTVFEGDLLEPASLEDALESVDAAYYLVHSMGSGAGFEYRDRQAARGFERAASTAGLERVIYLSGLGDDRDGLSEHLRSRREVETLLAAGTYDLTILRAAVIVGDGSASFRMIRQLATRLPVMVTPRWVYTECQPIAVEDVIAYLVGVLETPETAGETYEIGGPEVLTYREMLEETARKLGGRDPVVLPVPFLTPRLSAYWVDLVTDVPASVAHPLIDGMGNRVVVTDSEIRDVLDVELTPFPVAVDRALEAERRGGIGGLESPPSVGGS